MLSGNQANEEVPHSPEDCKGDAAKFEFSKYDPFLVHDNTYTHPFLTGVQQYIHFAISIPASHAGEIPTPPPDAAV